MVDRVDTVHIKIKFDIDPQDKAFVENLSSEMARADELGVKKQVEVKEKPKKKKEVLGPPTKTQWEIQQVEEEIKNLKEKIKKTQKKTDKQVLKERETYLNTLYRKELKAGTVGKLNNLGTKVSANLIKFATNPGAFFVAGLIKVLTKYGKGFARGGPLAVLAILIYATVLFVIDQYMQPGRLLDRRFKRIARIETMNFYERQLQEELRHGYQEIRVTTMQGLRGGQSQVNGNLFEFASGTTTILQYSPYRNSQIIYRSQNASGAVTDANGSPKRRTVSGRYG